MKKFKSLITILLISLMLNTLGASENIKTPSIAELQELADKGDATAQCSLAILYLQGKKVGKNNKKAIEYFEKSAEQGNPTAQCHLGGFYMRGTAGVKKDKQKAFEYHTKAAAQNYPNALYKLGLHYALNEGNYSKAFELFEKAAKQGQTSAQYELAQLYMEGKGVEKNEAEASNWAKKSANGGYKKAKEFLKKL